MSDDKFLLKDEVHLISYWLGTPCKWDSRLEQLPLGLPEKDLGGRALFMPSSETPASLFDRTMPQIASIVAKSDRDIQTGVTPNGARHPFGYLGQGVQLNWLFTAQAFSQQQTRISQLEARLKKLESLVSADSEDPKN